MCVFFLSSAFDMETKDHNLINELKGWAVYIGYKHSIDSSTPNQIKPEDRPFKVFKPQSSIFILCRIKI